MATLKRGPRPPVDETPLPFTVTGDDVVDFCAFCEKYIRLDNGVHMVVADWQRSIVEMLWCEPRPKLAALAIGRGNAKSTLAAAICLYRLYLNDDFAIDLLAVDERQAGIIGNICVKMIGRHPAMAKRAQLFKDHIVVRGSELWWLPATAAAIEGRTPDFTVCDEGGRIDREVYEVAAFSNSKRPHAQLFLIGTPGPDPENVLAQFRSHALAYPGDVAQRFMEFSADRWPDHPLDCDDHGGGLGTGCLSAANPAVGQWLSRESLLSNLPPKTSESHWRRVRLIHWSVPNADAPLPPGLFENLGNGEGVAEGSEVVLAFDGSYSGTDATVLAVAGVAACPHIDIVRVWVRPPEADSTWRVPILEVEQAIRDACVRWDVKEIAADEYRWQRSLAVLESEGLPVVKFPQTISRMSAATAEFLTACRNGQLSHSGDATLVENMNNAVLTEDNRGGRLVKQGRHAGRIDAAICAVMANSRAKFHATHRKRRYRAASFN